WRNGRPFPLTPGAHTVIGSFGERLAKCPNKRGLDAGRETSNVCVCPEKRSRADMKSGQSHAKSNELSDELARLPALGAEQLKDRWRALYETEPPPRISEDLLRRAVAYRIQERTLGSLKPSTSRLLQRIAEDARRSQSSTAAAKLRPGAVLIREW